MKRVFRLIDNAVKQRAMAELTNTPVGCGKAVSIQDEGRSNAENRLLHTLIAEIAANKDWAGKKRDLETWKRLLVAAWCRVHGEAIEILPALDGHGFDIVPARTSKLSKKECADLIEFIYAWGSENDIIWADHK